MRILLNMNIKTFPNNQELAKFVSEFFFQANINSIKNHGRFNVVLAGGSTPKTTYRILGSEPYISQVDWQRTHLFWGDERCVNPTHPDSNYYMTKESLIKNIPIADDQIYRMKGELKPTFAARSYEETLKTKLGKDPSFDMVILGIGQDGHTASLFPRTAAVRKTHHWVKANYVEKLDSWRLTLTSTIINKAKRIVFLVSGENKAKIVKQIRTGKFLPNRFPVQLIYPNGGEFLMLGDQAALKLLK